MKIKGLLLLLFILLTLVVAGFIGSQNSHLVSINYILAETEMRMSLLLAVTFLLGVIFSVLLILGYILRLKWRIGSLERKNKKLSMPANVT
ncbi:LapA family protein [Paraglaciecola arctica]|uniref:LapA family protein n=1 Tax=Paraglaciecola arctica TaxID=1128911 RepID=UPI001C0729DC|nr:LapA family protein [Paraglaciecola arctica]MBU3005198.1 LapA family protein [Paraglaciecola arctica]